MALLQINADLRQVVKALMRIADALDMHLRLAYNYRATPPSKAELGGDEAGVQYATDEDTLKREAEDARREIEHAEDEAGLVK